MFKVSDNCAKFTIPALTRSHLFVIDYLDLGTKMSNSPQLDINCLVRQYLEHRQLVGISMEIILREKPLYNET